MSDYFAIYLVSGKLKKTFCQYYKMEKADPCATCFFRLLHAIRIHFLTLI